MPPGLFHLASVPAEFVVTGIWQGLLVAGGAWIGLKAAPKLAPRARFLLWLAVFLLAALLPFAGLLAPSGSADLPAQIAKIPSAHLSAAWALALAGLWALASLLSLLRLALNGYELHRLAQSSTKLPLDLLAPELRALLGQTVLKQPMHQPAMKTGPEKGGARPISLCLSQRLDTPMVIGFFHPAIVLPEWLWKKLTPSELNQVVLHEIAHLRRKDDWTNLLQKFLRALFPLNPALLWAERQLCREREMACDDAVLDAAIAPRDYAASLASMAEKRLLRHAQSLAPGAWRRRSELAERVHRILKRNRRLSALSTRPVVAIFLAAFLCFGAVLARSPRIVTFLPPQFPANAAVASIPARASVEGRSQNGLRKLPGARFEPASLRPVVPQPVFSQSAAPARKDKRKLKSAVLRRRSLRRAELRPLDQSSLALSADAIESETIQPEIVLAVWEISPPLSVLSESGFSYFSYSPAAAFRTNGGWIIFQL